MKTEPTEKEKLIEGLEVEISNCQDDLDAASWAYEEGILICKREAVALLDLAKSSPKIKQLEWVEVYKSIFNADSSFKYAYEIHVIDDGSTILFDSSARKPKRFINMKDAKAAAQADFERRVMECLDLKAQQKQALIDMMRGDEQIGLYDDNPKNQ